MVGKDSLVCFGAFVFLGAFSYYSFMGYQTAFTLSPYGGGLEQQEVHGIPQTLSIDAIESLSSDLDQDSFASIKKRNPFMRFRVVVKPKPKPIKIDLPKPKIEIIQVEEQPEPQPIENYFFRGKVILGDNASYAVERESDGKTFFVNKGDKTPDFLVLETTEKQVVITDYNENVRVLRKNQNESE